MFLLCSVGWNSFIRSSTKSFEILDVYATAVETLIHHTEKQKEEMSVDIKCLTLRKILSTIRVSKKGIHFDI